MTVKRITPERIGVSLPRLGFGGMRLPTGADGKIHREAADRIVEAAMEGGVNYFDTAYPYHNGGSEPYLGESLSRFPRESFYLASKMPTWLFDGNPETVKRIFAEQLERCRVDYFDFYLIHGLGEDRYQPLKEIGAYEYLAEMKRQGKIRHLGFSFHGGYDIFVTYLEEYRWDFVQIQHNYIDEEKLQSGRLYDLLRQKGIPAIIMEPVRGGFLANPPEEALEALRNLDGGKTSAAGWALRWCLDQDNSAVILSGMSSMEQLRDNLATFDEAAPLHLTEREAEGIRRVREIILSVRTVPCTACRYCMDCPFGVDIPENFTLYNDYKLFQDAFAGKDGYAGLTARKAGAAQCKRCGVCIPLCPQGIVIPDRLREVEEALQAIQ